MFFSAVAIRSLSQLTYQFSDNTYLHLRHLVPPRLLPLAQIFMPPHHYTCLLHLLHLPEGQSHYCLHIPAILNFL